MSKKRTKAEVAGDHLLGLGFGQIREMVAYVRTKPDGDDTLGVLARRICEVDPEVGSPARQTEAFFNDIQADADPELRFRE